MWNFLVSGTVEFFFFFFFFLWSIKIKSPSEHQTRTMKEAAVLLDMELAQGQYPRLHRKVITILIMLYINSTLRLIGDPQADLDYKGTIL